jgi:hypothetical protein
MEHFVRIGRHYGLFSRSECQNDGSGLVCNTLLANGLAELCWLAAPTSWPDFSAWYQTKRWKLVQLPTTQCGGRSVDFNLADGGAAEYGQFGN